MKPRMSDATLARLEVIILMMVRWMMKNPERQYRHLAWHQASRIKPLLHHAACRSNLQIVQRLTTICSTQLCLGIKLSWFCEKVWTIDASSSRLAKSIIVHRFRLNAVLWSGICPSQKVNLAIPIHTSHWIHWAHNHKPIIILSCDTAFKLVMNCQVCQSFGCWYLVILSYDF